MDWDRIEGDWKQFSGRLKQKWGDLTDSELDKIAGKKNELIGILQTRYGYAKDRARDEAEKWAQSLNSSLANVAVFAGDAARKATHLGREASEGIGEVGGNMDTAVRKSVSDQPMASLAVAALVGFTLGALWKS